MYLSQFRAGLIDARVQSLLVQGEIIAGAIAASATVDTDAITIDPDRLLQLQAGESYGPAGRLPLRRRIPDQSRTRRAGAAAADLADQDARAHLRPRRRAHSRQPQSLRPRRRAALRSAAAERRAARSIRAGADRYPPLVRARRPADLQGARAGERQGLSGSRAGAQWRADQPGARQRPRRSDRLGRRAGAALPCRARRADAVDARRRHRRHGAGRAVCDLQGVPDRGRRDDGALDAARRHDRRSRAAARRRRRARAPAYPQSRGDSGFHPPSRRDRPSVRRAARHDRTRSTPASRRSRASPPTSRTNCAIRSPRCARRWRRCRSPRPT